METVERLCDYVAIVHDGRVVATGLTEIVRAGLQSVPKAQIEAGESLGMNPADVTRFVVLPQAFRNVLPPMAGQLIQLIKDSSLEIGRASCRERVCLAV